MNFRDKSIRICTHCGSMGQTLGGKFPPDGVGGKYCLDCKTQEQRTQMDRINAELKILHQKELLNDTIDLIRVNQVIK